MRNSLILIVMLGMGLAMAGCGAQGRKSQSVAGSTPDLSPVLVQGPMPVESEKLAGRLDNVSEEKVGGWTFWRGTVDGYPVIVSKTMKGVSNTAAATAIAVERYHPVAIINQGTAGGHDPELNVYDIVLGRDSVNLGSFKTPDRRRGQGSNSLEWKPMDLLASEGSAGNDPNALKMRRFKADDRLLATAESVKHRYLKGRVVKGVIGSGEVWDSELDRIHLFHTRYETSLEEMETASAAQIAGIFKIPFLGIRVLSNNITNGGKYDPKTAEACQDYVYEVVKALIATLQKK